MRQHNGISSDYGTKFLFYLKHTHTHTKESLSCLPLMQSAIIKAEDLTFEHIEQLAYILILLEKKPIYSI